MTAQPLPYVSYYSTQTVTVRRRYLPLSLHPSPFPLLGSASLGSELLAQLSLVWLLQFGEPGQLIHPHPLCPQWHQVLQEALHVVPRW